MSQQRTTKVSKQDGQVQADKTYELIKIGTIQRHVAFGKITICSDSKANGMWTHPAGMDCSLQVGFCIARKRMDKTLIPISAQVYVAPEQYNGQRGMMLSSVIIDTSGNSTHILEGPSAQRSGTNSTIHTLSLRHVVSFKKEEGSFMLTRQFDLDSLESDFIYMMSWFAVPARNLSSRKSMGRAFSALAGNDDQITSLRRINSNGLASISILQSLNSELCEANLNTLARCYKSSPEISSTVSQASIRIAWCVAHVELPTNARFNSLRWAPNHGPSNPDSCQKFNHTEKCICCADIEGVDERSLSAHGTANVAEVQFSPLVSLAMSKTAFKPTRFHGKNFLIRNIFTNQHHALKVDKLAPLVQPKHRSVLLTGGLGGLGYLLTAYMIHSARCRNVLVLSTSGRAGKFNEASIFSHSLCNILRSKVGLMDETGCASAAGKYNMTLQLTTIMHASGKLNDATILNQTVGKFYSVSSPKFTGLQRMVDAFINSQALSNILLFSSIASLIGSSGQINYAMANGVMDELAESMQNAGSPISSIEWGAWGEEFDGMTSDNGSILSRMRRNGMGVLKPQEGVSALDFFHCLPRDKVLKCNLDHLSI